MSERLVIYCLVGREDEDLVEGLRAHYADDDRVRVILDRRSGQDRRGARDVPPNFDRRRGLDRRRGVVPRRLRALPPEIAARAGNLRWVQRMLPIGVGTEALEFDEVVHRVRAHDPEAPTELFWRVYERMHSRLVQLYGDGERADAAVVAAYGRVLDALDNPDLASVSFEDLLYGEIEALHRSSPPQFVLHAGLRVDDPELDERVEVKVPDPDWDRVARLERDTLTRRFGTRVVQIEHIGSTAVAGVAARPIIDLLVGVRRMPAGPELRDALVNMGYSYCGGAGSPDRDYYRRRAGHAPVDLHVVEYDGPLWREAIAVREHLRRSPADAHRWSMAKTRAARHSGHSLIVYSQAREAALGELLGRAVETGS